MSFRILSQLKRIIKYVEPVSSTILENLTSSEVAAFTYAIGIKLNDSHYQPYLSPIRELPQYHEWLAQLLKCGYKVTLVGKDLTLLMERITRPDRFWVEHERSPPISVWLATTVDRDPVEAKLLEDWVTLPDWYEYLILPDMQDMQVEDIGRSWLCANSNHVETSHNSLNEAAFYFYWWHDIFRTRACNKVSFTFDLADASGNHWWDREERMEYEEDLLGLEFGSPPLLRTIKANEMFETNFINVHVDPFHLQTVRKVNHPAGRDAGRNVIRMGLRGEDSICHFSLGAILIPTGTNGRCQAYGRLGDRTFPRVVESADNKKRTNDNDNDNDDEQPVKKIGRLIGT